MLESASRGRDLLWRGVSPPGGVSAPRGVSAPKGVCSGGVCSGGGGLLRGEVSQHALRQTPPVNRMTNRCKNITLATTSLRPVKMHFMFMESDTKTQPFWDTKTTTISFLDIQLLRTERRNIILCKVRWRLTVVSLTGHSTHHKLCAPRHLPL